VQIDGRVAPVACQCRGVVVVVSIPLSVIHTQAVHDHQNLAVRFRYRGRKRIAFERERPAIASQPHGNRQWVRGFEQVVTQDSVQRAPRRGCLRLSDRRRPLPRKKSQRPIQYRPRNAVHQASAAVNEPGDAPGTPVRAPAQGRGSSGDIRMHRLDDMGHLLDGVKEKSTRTARDFRSLQFGFDHDQHIP